LAVNDIYNVDAGGDLAYDVDAQGYSFVSLTDLGISSTDFSYDNHRLTILNDFLKYFTDVRAYELQLTLTLGSDEAVLPVSFSVQHDHPSNQIINGGFETGDLSGWDGYPIWKDEAAMYSWQAERVVSTDFYGSAGANPYNKDGQYLLGVYATPYVNANKDLNQERMGMLRSSDFIVGGSGWISFKLGGGRNPASAYISIKETGTNIEVARYANRHFSDTALSGTANAEAYLFQYYADLSAHFGDSLYIMLVDAASHEWNVLSADSFVTYHAVAPTPTADQVAIDIKPVISGVGTATNAITSNFATDLGAWEDPQGILQWQDARARTNKTTGDAAYGAIRSPAFNINGPNTYFSWEWEGNIQLDKQLFASIKEVGTNTEVLRLTRRENLSTKNGGGLDKHWYDLSGLDVGKEYYAEFVDNTQSAWGLISIRNVYLLPSNDSRVSVSGDQAVNVFYGLALVNAQNGQHRTAANDFSYVPSTAAFNVVTTFGEHPEQQVRINYATYEPHTYVVYHKVGYADTFSVSPSSTVSTLTNYGSRLICHVEINNLTPDTAYEYQVFNRASAGPIYRFRTLGATSTQFAFLADAQATDFAESKVYNRMLSAAITYAPNIRFGLEVGDTVERGGNEQMWEWYFEAGTQFNNFPMMTLPGNHDYYTSDGVLDSINYYNANFNNPKNGPDSALNSSYYFKTADTLFVMLNTVTDNYGSAQIDWFHSVVDANPTTFIVVATHYSAYGSYHPTTGGEFLNVWGPVFDSENVDIVLSGHDHVYARTPRMLNDAVASEANLGTVYFTGGSASAKIYDVDPDVTAQYEYYMPTNQNVITVVTLNGDSISFTAINQAGQVVDTFTLNPKTRS